MNLSANSAHVYVYTSRVWGMRSWYQGSVAGFRVYGFRVKGAGIIIHM